MKYNKIFGIGLGKTGTTSLACALNILGIKTIHNSSEVKKHINYERKNGLKILSTLKKFKGFTELPFVDKLYKELDKKYLNSKFILTIRDVDSWLISRKKHVKRYQLNPAYKGNWMTVDKDSWRIEWKRHYSEVTGYFKR